MVLAHRPRTQRRPRLAVGTVTVERALDRVREGGRFVLAEGEPVPLSGVRVEVMHGVRKTADSPHDRDGAVAERDELP